jgi:uridine kinase
VVVPVEDFYAMSKKDFHENLVVIEEVKVVLVDGVEVVEEVEVGQPVDARVFRVVDEGAPLAVAITAELLIQKEVGGEIRIPVSATTCPPKMKPFI